MIDISTFQASRATLGTLIGVVAQALVLVAAFIAGRTVKPQGGGFEDLVAVLGTLVIGEIIVAIACLVVGIMQIAKGRRDLGIGIIAGWLIGGLLGFVVVQAS